MGVRREEEKCREPGSKEEEEIGEERRFCREAEAPCASSSVSLM